MHADQIRVHLWLVICFTGIASTQDDVADERLRQFRQSHLAFGKPGQKENVEILYALYSRHF